MKTIIITLSALFTISVTAQNNPITTGLESFENWTNVTVGELPNSWDGFNKEIEFNGMTVGEIECVTKDSLNPKEGSYNVKITSESIMGGPAVPGLLTTGKVIIDWNAQDGDVVSGEAMTLTPTQLKGWFKYTPAGTDSAFVAVWFNQNGIEIGSGRIDIGDTTDVWTEFIVDIDFPNGGIPDSMNVLFASSNSMGAAPLGSVFEIDAVEFVYNNVGINENDTKNITIYPNPAANLITLSNLSSGRNQIRIINCIGQIVLEETTTHEQTDINLTHLNTGTYFVHIENDGVLSSHTIQVK